jgi:HSP20 family molecular chaperone IbpA
VDPDEVHAHYDRGLLTIELRKAGQG